MLRVEPEIPGVSINVYGNSIEISGETKGQTTYTVTVSGKIQDIFGQKLGEDTRLTFKVGKADPVLVGPEQIFLTLDPAAPKANLFGLCHQLQQTQPEDLCRSTLRLAGFKQYLREWQQTDTSAQNAGQARCR